MNVSVKNLVNVINFVPLELFCRHTILISYICKKFNWYDYEKNNSDSFGIDFSESFLCD